MAQITLSLEDWNNELGKRALLEAELAKMRTELNETRMLNLESIRVNAVALDAAVRASLVLTRFAVANLPPEMTPGWPVGALDAVIVGLPHLPTYGIDDADLLSELRAMARDIGEQDRRRRQG